ncbi:hypothetical protein [Rickettsiales endosymbiont of Stachyamoeba lipophora]|uniref:hypothetical protein n=1 Tax=Rickettsiales endosymbiont of Stachyamoeba lipophora TaxID=2486578 RepID=UPI000F64920D|nr:hypothetical protein [Rickettsiales endosymbiont of Stachyamoeba lipophora]AZL15576.1 hypothetical protein EF513_03295 [Rickettsiales endosymbiont of Stachyamoeba lipophora]
MQITYDQFNQTKHSSIPYNDHIIRKDRAFISAQHQDTQFAPERYTDNAEATGFIEFRIAIKPTAENLQKAFEIAYPILCDNGLHNWKILNFPEVGTDLPNWDIYAGDDRFRDQKGKELCCYISYNPHTKKAEKTSAEYKDLILKLVKSFVDNNIEFGYYPAQSDQAIKTEEHLPELVTYISTYKTRNRSDGLTNETDEAKFVANGWDRNPLLDIKLTSIDYQNYGISLSKLLQIKREQTAYSVDHYTFAREKIHEELQLFLTDKLGEQPWLKQIIEISDKLMAKPPLTDDPQAERKNIKDILDKYKTASPKAYMLSSLLDGDTFEPDNFRHFHNEVLKIKSYLEKDLQIVKQEIISAKLLGTNDGLSAQLDKVTSKAYMYPDKIKVLKNSIYNLAREKARSDQYIANNPTYYQTCRVASVKQNSLWDRLISWSNNHVKAANMISIVGSPLLFIPTVIFGTALSKRDPNQVLELAQGLIAGSDQLAAAGTKARYSKFYKIQDAAAQMRYLAKEINTTQKGLNGTKSDKFLQALNKILEVGTLVQDEATNRRAQSLNSDLNKILPQVFTIKSIGYAASSAPTKGITASDSRRPTSTPSATPSAPFKGRGGRQ